MEAAAKSAPPKPKKAPKPKKSTVTSVVDALSFKAGEPGEPEEEEEEEAEEDPVEAALAKYGIITENPWEKGIKCAPRPPSIFSLLYCPCPLDLHCQVETELEEDAVGARWAKARSLPLLGRRASRRAPHPCSQHDSMRPCNQVRSHRCPTCPA